MDSRPVAEGGFEPAARLPSVQQIKAEIARARRRQALVKSAWSGLRTIVCAMAAAALAAVLLLPVLRVNGSSMAPLLVEGDLVVAVKGASFEAGDLLAFYHGDKILVKRVIALPGQEVDIADDGSVYVDGDELAEPYLDGRKSLGSCDIDLPCRVPQGSLFVMGDNRATSLDSRNTAIGCIADEQVLGKAVCRIWPLDRAGVLDSRTIEGK